MLFTPDEYRQRMDKTRSAMTEKGLNGDDTLGLECSEAVYVTDTGCDTFARVPRQLFIK